MAWRLGCATRLFPRHCLSQAGPRRQCPVAPGRPLPSLCYPLLPYRALAASATRCCEGAPSVCVSQGRPHPGVQVGASQRSDPAHLQKPSKIGIFPLQVGSGLPPVKRVPKNSLLRPGPLPPAPPPPTHTRAACTSPSGGLVAGWPAPATVCAARRQAARKEPGGWLQPPPRDPLLSFGVVACQWPEAIPEIGKLFSDFNH